MIKILLATSLFTIFLVLSAIHVYWGFGGKWGISAALPTKANQQKAISPTSFECFVVAVGLLVFALLPLIIVGMLKFALPNWLAVYGLWIMSAVFTVRAIGEFRYVGFFKRIKNTDFARSDTKFYSPLCLAIAVLLLLLEFIK